VQPGEVERYLASRGVEVRRRSGTELVCRCPWCPPDAKDPALKVQEDDGRFHCFRCQRKGGFLGLKRELGDLEPIRRAFARPTVIAKASAATTSTPKPQPSPELERRLAAVEANLWGPAGAAGLAYLRGRGFTDETIRRFRFGFEPHYRFPGGDGPEPGIVIPFLTGGRPVLFKLRNLAPADSPKRIAREPAGKMHPLFNVDGLEGAAGGTVYLAEGELDAVSLEQMGFSPAVSGDNGAGFVDDSWRELLLDFDRIAVVYDADKGGAEGFEKVAGAFGAYRCARVTLPRGAKDANVALRAGVPVEEIRAAVDAAESPMRGLVLSYRDALDARAAEDEKKILGGTGWAALDHALGGLRPAELTVFCGEPGCGKTSFLADFARRQAVLGRPVLFGSFENRPEDVAQDVEAARRAAAAQDPDGAAAALVALERNLWFIRAAGKVPVDTLRDVTLFAVRRFGIQFAVFDNLHAFLPYEATSERFEIDRAVDTLDALAKTYALHVVLVAHLRKRANDAPRGGRDLNDILGSIGPGRVASNVLYLERLEATWPHCRARLTLLKARSKAAIQGARVLFAYAPDARTFRDLAAGDEQKEAKTQRNRFARDARTEAAGLDAEERAEARGNGNGNGGDA